MVIIDFHHIRMIFLNAIDIFKTKITFKPIYTVSYISTIYLIFLPLFKGNQSKCPIPAQVQTPNEE